MLFGQIFVLTQFLKILLRNLFYIVIVLACVNVLILEEGLGMTLVLVLTHLAAHLLALVACKYYLLVKMH